MLIRFYIFLFCLLITLTCKAQVNIESYQQKDLTRKDGFHGQLIFGMYGRDNGSSLLDFHTDFSSSYRLSDTLFLLSAGNSFYDSSGIISKNYAYAHLRNNTVLHDFILSDAFLQVETNPIIKLYSRSLAGLGLRLEEDTDNLFFSLGTSYMYEINNVPNNIITIHRWNNFGGFELKMDNFIFNEVFYIQPAMTDFDNYRILNFNTIKVDINKRLSVGISLQYRYESIFPATGTYAHETKVTNDLIWSW